MSDKNKGNGKNPWGSAPKKGRTPPKKISNNHSSSNGNEPIDIDTVLRKAKSDFDGLIPGNLSGGTIGLIIGAALLFLFFTLCTYIVKPGEHAVIQRFGAWERTKTEEGLSFKFPFIIETVSKVNVNEIRKMNIGFIENNGRGRSTGSVQDVPTESLMLTSDRNIVDIHLVIQWNIKSAEDFLFNIRDQERTIKKVAESAIREQIGQTNMFPIITTERDSVAQLTRAIIQTNLDEYNSGVNITQVLIQRAEVHPGVQQAFQDVQSAKQDADNEQNIARAYREDILPKARGNAIQITQRAEAYKESTVAKATGDADRFNAIYQAYLSGKDVTKKRMYIEMMEEVLSKAQKIILDNNGGKQSVIPYLPLSELKPAAGSSAKTNGK